MRYNVEFSKCKNGFSENRSDFGDSKNYSPTQQKDI